MHRRCCCPPDRPAPGRSRRSLTSSQRLAPAQRALDDLLGLLLGHLAVELAGRRRRSRRWTSSGTGWAAGRPCRRCGAPRPGPRRRRRCPGRRAATRALDAGAGDDLVHPVDRAQRGRLAAAGRADEGGDRARLDRQGHVCDGAEAAVEGVDVVQGDLLGHRGPLIIGRGARAVRSHPAEGVDHCRAGSATLGRQQGERSAQSRCRQGGAAFTCCSCCGPGAVRRGRTAFTGRSPWPARPSPRLPTVLITGPDTACPVRSAAPPGSSFHDPERGSPL